jgi:hypothetical protein
MNNSNPFLQTYTGNKFPNDFASFNGKLIVMESFSVVEEGLFDVLQSIDSSFSENCDFYMTEIFNLQEMDNNTSALRTIKDMSQIRYANFESIALSFSHDFVGDYIFTSDSGMYIGYYHWNFDIMLVIYKTESRIPCTLLEQLPRINTIQELLNQIISVGARPTQQYVNEIVRNFSKYF